ncbi:murein DD-endopeptidase MepM/ murein hydrolase activator NlpD [Roseiarcus fermentans]|uniref:Murein DD-endopeptidase MepM/ murein hydrolase activator NlpD n=1 Tax=Roseiarcus fermentans TaxID=1473586 RepID=A0A366FQ31_9HYPH|nr:M23 family metallopeptidase [Roseiarcus fermentans]RBP16814.1 murein DD-endopeptidase MepM/ murein hydrolase activator NlpD [Roseiarcus fermentans]
MSDRVAFLEGRAVPRLALTGLALIWLSGCSQDVARFDSNPLSNPFATQTAQATPPAAAAPAGQAAAAPLAPAASVASAPLPAPAASTAQAVGGSAKGWSAAGGTPVTVANGENLDALSRRYGVPSSALLAANGLSSPAEVRSGMRIVVPVYNAGGRAVASAPAARDDAKAVADAAPKAKKRTEEVADAGDKPAKVKKAEDKAKKAEDRTAAKTAAAKGPDLPEKPEPAQVAKADPAKPDAQKTAGKKQGVDDTPTGAVDSKAGAKEPAAEADASGANPEFRWPARGRIIQGFKTGGNDGIDISVPTGTSVRAAESGVVVYSGDGLKGYGNLVLIKHPNGYVTAYANNGELDVKRGEQVKRGQVIAKSGDTGNVNAPQLHFELRKGSTPVDPTSYLAGL